MSTRNRTASRRNGAGETKTPGGNAASGARNRGGRGARGGAKRRGRAGDFGPIAFFVSLFIVAVGAIQLVSAFNTYAQDLTHLNSLKREEAALIAQKQELENDISRWDDKNYVAAQARDRLGFVFPGEQSVHVMNPQAVTGEDSAREQDTRKDAETQKQLPWYSELAYAFEQADEPVDDDSDAADAKTSSEGSASSDASGADTKTGGQQDQQQEKGTDQ